VKIVSQNATKSKVGKVVIVGARSGLTLFNTSFLHINNLINFTLLSINSESQPLAVRCAALEAQFRLFVSL